MFLCDGTRGCMCKQMWRDRRDEETERFRVRRAKKGSRKSGSPAPTDPGPGLGRRSTGANYYRRKKRALAHADSELLCPLTSDRLLTTFHFTSLGWRLSSSPPAIACLLLVHTCIIPLCTAIDPDDDDDDVGQVSDDASSSTHHTTTTSRVCNCLIFHSPALFHCPPLQLQEHMSILI